MCVDVMFAETATSARVWLMPPDVAVLPTD